MTLKHIKHESGDYTFDTETRVWTKLDDTVTTTTTNANDDNDNTDLQGKILKNPDNFYAELSPDYFFLQSAKKSKWG